MIEPWQGTCKMCLEISHTQEEEECSKNGWDVSRGHRGHRTGSLAIRGRGGNLSIKIMVVIGFKPLDKGGASELALVKGSKRLSV